MTLPYIILLLALTVMTGCAAVCVALVIRQRKINADINRLKAVFQDFLSIQERNLADLRNQIGVPRTHVTGGEGRSEGFAIYSGGMAIESPFQVPKSEDSGNSTVYQESLEMPLKKKQVWDLADAGLDIEEISRQTGLPSGQVDVIVNMRRIVEGGGA